MTRCQYGECPRPAVVRLTLARTPTAVLRVSVCLAHVANVTKNFEVIADELVESSPWLRSLPSMDDIAAMKEVP